MHVGKLRREVRPTAGRASDDSGLLIITVMAELAAGCAEGYLEEQAMMKSTNGRPLVLNICTDDEANGHKDCRRTTRYSHYGLKSGNTTIEEKHQPCHVAMLSVPYLCPPERR